MPLFNIDDKKVKSIIKTSVGAKEGDFAGNKMMCGTTVNPVVVINSVPTLQPIVTFSVTAVQNVWYEVCSLEGSLNIIATDLNMATLAEDVEAKWVIDGIEFTDQQAGAVAGTDYYSSRYFDFSGASILLSDTAVYGHELLLQCRTFVYSIRKTSANGANALRGAVWYEKW